MSESHQDVALPPRTGQPTIDAALESLADLPTRPLAEHHERLAAVQDVLGGVLDSSRSGSPSPIPEGLRPKGAAAHHG